MSFISYAQNFEDVMLWRALKHVQNGFYIDVGAEHPVNDSVSQAFYERGWRGIHIEPVFEYAALLRKERPDETVLQIALTDTDAGTLTLNVISDSGLSTAVYAYAQQHKLELGYTSEQVQVPAMTLKTALQSLEFKDVHWLKIDVEGFEEKVIKGWDSQILRPWIMVIEATTPNKPELDYAKWDPVLIAADYLFVYFDGLNRFYVAKEHAELIDAFSAPPNVFDEIQRAGFVGLESQYEATKHKLDKLDHSFQQERQALLLSTKQLLTLEEKYASLQTDYAAEKTKIDELNHLSLEQQQKLLTSTRQLLTLEEKYTSLQTDYTAAKTKIDELNHSSHHWWTVADGLNRELQSVYASKSWKITRPLRQARLVSQWVASLPRRGAHCSIRRIKSLAKPMVIWAMKRALANAGLKRRALVILTKYPQIKRRLHQLALRSSLLINREVTSPIASLPPTSEALDMPELIKNFSPRVVGIYASLQKTINARKC